eukprot:4989955-Ditylum_brightwellii.AAC.1
MRWLYNWVDERTKGIEVKEINTRNETLLTQVAVDKVKKDTTELGKSIELCCKEIENITDKPSEDRTKFDEENTVALESNLQEWKKE